MEMAVLLLTIVLSAISAGLATYCLNVCKERLSFRAKKAEEAYCAAELLEARLTRFFESRYELVETGLHPTFSEDTESVGDVFVRLKMLVGFYFPALSLSFSRAASAAATSYRSLKAFDAAIDGGERQSQVSQLDAAVVEMKDALNALKNAILAAGCEEQAVGSFTLFRRSAKSVNGQRILTVSA
jgi:hypothetical protein